MTIPLGRWLALAGLWVGSSIAATPAGPPLPGAAAAPAVLGFYDVRQSALVNATMVRVRLDIRLQNQGPTAISRGDVELRASGIPGPALGHFAPLASLASQQVVRISGSFVVPLATFRGWRAGLRPGIEVRGVDGSGHPVSTLVTLLPLPGAGG